MINVYPNPTTGKFNVTVENAGEVVVKVGDILGNVLDVNVIDNLNGTYSVDLSVVADGVYFVQVKNGDYFATKIITGLIRMILADRIALQLHLLANKQGIVAKIVPS